MTIEEFLRMLLRNALLLLAVTALGAGLGYAYSYTKPEVYEAQALGFVSGATGAGTGEGQQSYSKAQFFLPLFTTKPVAEAIEAKTGFAPGGIEVSLNPDAAIITVNAQAGSPEAAAAIANASIEAVSAEGEKLDPGTANMLAPYVIANQPGAPIGPNRTRFALVGAVLGLALAIALAWLRNRNDSRVRTVDDIRASVDVPALGVLPDVKDLARGKDGLLPEPSSFQSREAVRKLRTNLQFVNVDNPPRSIVVTSSAPGEGKSTVSGNLARVMASSGRRTILIDADLRRPMVATEFGIDGSVGLSQLLAGAVSLDEVLQPMPGGRFFILPAGRIPPNPSELLGSRRMHDLIAELSQEFFVVIDAPPVLAVTDAQLLSRHADGTILVAVPGRTRVEGLTRAVDSIHGVGGAVLGAVMNRASTSRFNRVAYGDAEYGYSSYGYSSYGKKGYGYGYDAATPTMSDDEVVAADELEPAVGPGAVNGSPAGSTIPAREGAVAQSAPAPRPAVSTSAADIAPASDAWTSRSDATRADGAGRRLGRRAALPSQDEQQ